MVAPIRCVAFCVALSSAAIAQEAPRITPPDKPKPAAESKLPALTFGGKLAALCMDIAALQDGGFVVVGYKATKRRTRTEARAADA